MTDFDFDELDKAVSGALDGTQPQNSMKPKEEPKSPPSSDQQLPSSTTPAARRGGRFMDMVRTPSYSSRPRPEDASGNRDSVDRKVPTAAEVQAKLQSVSSAATQAPAPETSPDSFQNDTSDNLQQPLESPFLTNAKVEKRPLGGVVPANKSFDASELLEAPDEPRLEADNEAPVHFSYPDPIDFAQNGASAETESNTEEVPSEQTEQAQPSGPTSISQQYEEHPSPAAAPGPIYDTEAYHKPMTQPVSHKSGIWVIVWIILLLVIGAGAGAAIYFFVLPAL